MAAVVLATGLMTVSPRIAPATVAAASRVALIAGGFTYVKTFAPQPAACVYNGGFYSVYYTRGDCIRITFSVAGSDQGSHTVKVQLRSSDGSTQFQEISASQSNSDPTSWFAVTPIDAGATPWQPGRIVARAIVDGNNAGEGEFFFNALGAVVNPGPLAAGDRYQPNEDIPLTGSVFELNDLAANTQKTGVAATYKIRVVDPEGNQLYLSPVQTANSDGTFAAGLKIPGSATSGVTSTAAEDYKSILGIQVVEASFTDTSLSPESSARTKGTFAGNPAGTGAVTIQVPLTTLTLENRYGSVTGWVKPGETFPFTVYVRNYTNSAKTSTTVSIPAPPSLQFVQANPLAGSGSASVGAGGIGVTWTIGNIAAATSTGPTVATLIVQAKAFTLAQDPEVVWKDLSNTATLSYNGGPTGANAIKASTRGPKVIPPAGDYETARYGDKPFVMVPVDFRDRTHDTANSGDALSRKVNSPTVPGSTFNLFQEMSYGQLYPNGDVPSAEIASAGFDYAPGFKFTSRDPLKPTCRGTTFGDLPPDGQASVEGSPAYPERIKDGWYQLPGDTEYYGGDFPAFTLGTGSTIDGACGPTGKAVYDAAVIADPEIDYNDFDLDRDGVVDFFMMVFAGKGGNGDSQINGTPPYDNIWPHSSSLEYYYTDATTGLKGYISNDQLKSLKGVPQCFVDATYTKFADCAANGGTGDNSKPVPVRVGPYNVNPESAIDKASVIAHEYGHHLGMPDMYSTSYTTYNDWNLQASDYSQHMTIWGKQEMGWVVPDFLQPGETRTVTGWNEIKKDTGQIRWQRPDGSFYTLSSANGDQNIHNGQAFGLKLPRRQLIDPAKVPSLPSLWYSGRGNDFGCTPTGGRNLDIALPELANLPSGTNVTVTYKSSWDMEWDYDYGFTMVTTDGQNYTSLPSAKGYTTSKTINPNNSACLNQYDNGLTGTSGSYRDNTQTVDRNPASPTYKDSPFLEDQYDLSSYAGKRGVVLRLSYYTDPGFDRPGWFMDDLVVKAGNNIIYSSDFTNSDPTRVVPGGCGDNGLRTAQNCTSGWSLVDATAGVSKDHAYYLELRDRSGFDYDGRGQSDRGSIGWAPGALIEYTDEARGYGNNGGSPPRQHYIDSQPEPGLDCGEALADDPTTPRDDTAKRCDDAAFTAASGDNHFSDANWIDNFSDPSSDDGLWHFNYNCLTLDVSSMSGTDANEALPSNLTATAVIKAAAGCAPFNYTGAYPNLAPAADAQVKPSTGVVNSNFLFDGSGSTDDITPASQLKYEWDWDSNGTYDATGQTLNHAFTTTGTKTVTLRVTDKSTPAKSSTDTVTVTVGTSTGKPDLTIAASSYTPTTIHKGNSVTFKATVKNIGQTAAAATKTQWFRYKANGMNPGPLGLVNTPALAPGQSAQVQLTISTANWKPGTYRIRVYADIKDVVSEQPPNNNNGFYFNITILR